MTTVQPLAWSDTPFQSILSRVYGLVTQGAPAELADVEAALRASAADLQAFVQGLNGLMSFAVVQLGDGAATAPKLSFALDGTLPTYTANLRFTAQPASGVSRVVRLVLCGGWSAGSLLEAVTRLADLRADPSGALGAPPDAPATGQLADPSVGVLLAAYVCEAAVRGDNEHFLNALCALIQAAPPSLGHTGIVADDLDDDSASASKNAVGVPKWLALNDGAGGLQLDLALSLQLPESDDPMTLRFKSSVSAEAIGALRSGVRRFWLPTEVVPDPDGGHWSIVLSRMVRALGKPDLNDSWGTFSGQPLNLVAGLNGCVTSTGCAGELPVKLSAIGAAGPDGVEMTLTVETAVDTFGDSKIQLGVSLSSADYEALRRDLLNTARKPAAAA